MGYERTLRIDKSQVRVDAHPKRGKCCRSSFSNTDILQKRPSTPTLKTYAISYLRNHTKSFEYTLEVLCLERQILEEISKLGGNLKLAIVKALDVREDKPPTTA
jgi:hypothetical protein